MAYNKVKVRIDTNIIHSDSVTDSHVTDARGTDVLIKMTC